MLWGLEFLPGVGGFKGEVDESSDELDEDDEEEEDEDKVSAFFFFFFFLLWLCLDVSSGIISLQSCVRSQARIRTTDSPIPRMT